MLTYAGVCWRMQAWSSCAERAAADDDTHAAGAHFRMLTYAHVCSRMLTYAHVCGRRYARRRCLLSLLAQISLLVLYVTGTKVLAHWYNSTNTDT
jgi:hypothetical protein